MLLLARKDVFLPIMGKVEATLVKMAHDLADVPMLSRTHGQSATPTTVGKEMANVAMRLRTQLAACAEFALANEPCLICCSSGSSLSVLCAAACVAARSKGAIGAGAALEAVSAKRGRVDLPADGEAELAAFCRDHQETGATHPYPVNVGVARSNSTGKRDAEAESPLTPASKAAKALGSTSLDVA